MAPQSADPSGLFDGFILLTPVSCAAADIYEFSMLPRYFPKKIQSMIDPLTENGIAVEDDCDLEVASDNKQENAIFSVSIGDVDVDLFARRRCTLPDSISSPEASKKAACIRPLKP